MTSGCSLPVKKKSKSQRKNHKSFLVVVLLVLGILAAFIGLYQAYPELINFAGVTTNSNSGLNNNPEKTRSNIKSKKSSHFDTSVASKPEFASDPNAVSEVKVSESDNERPQIGPVKGIKTQRISDTKKTKKKKKLVHKDDANKAACKLGIFDANLPIQEYDMEEYKEMADKIVFVKEKDQKTSKIASHAQLFYNIPRFKKLINNGDKPGSDFQVFQRIFKAMDEAKGGSTVYFELSDEERAALSSPKLIIDHMDIMPINLVNKETGKKVTIPTFRSSYSQTLSDTYGLVKGDYSLSNTISQMISLFLTHNKLEFEKPLPDYFFVQTSMRSVGNLDFELKIDDQVYRLIAFEEPRWFNLYDIVYLRSPLNDNLWSYIDQESVKKISTEELESDSNSQTNGTLFVYQRVFTEDEKASLREKAKKAFKKAALSGLLPKKMKKIQDAEQKQLEDALQNPTSDQTSLTQKSIDSSLNQSNITNSSSPKSIPPKKPKKPAKPANTTTPSPTTSMTNSSTATPPVSPPADESTLSSTAKKFNKFFKKHWTDDNDKSELI